MSDGRVEIAFFGSDKLEEWRAFPTSEYELFGNNCKFVMFGQDETDFKRLENGETVGVTTSNPRFATRIAQENGWNLDIVTVSGKVEGYVAAGDTELGIDISDTGNTVSQNGLTIFETLGEILVYPCTNLQYCPELNPREIPFYESIRNIGNTLLDRCRLAQLDPEFSYTTRLLADQNRRVKKFGEESAEYLQAVLRPELDIEEIKNEAADLLYTVQCLAIPAGITLEDILRVDIDRNKV